LLYFVEGHRIGVVHGFVKKTQKTPADDLALARRRMKEMQAWAKRIPIGARPLDEFLAEDGIREAAKGEAVTRVVAWQLTQEMERQGITKAALAERMHTSRAQVDRILKAKGNVTIESLQRAAALIGRELRLELVWQVPWSWCRCATIRTCATFLISLGINNVGVASGCMWNRDRDKRRVDESVPCGPITKPSEIS
jgi:antitoxin HicB